MVAPRYYQAYRRYADATRIPLPLAIARRCALAIDDQIGGTWGRRPRVARLADDSKVYVRPWYGIERAIYLYGLHSPLVWDTLRLLIRPGHVVIDVGAHVGQFSLLAGNLVRDWGRVFAIEPNPETRPLLYRNIAANGLTNVEVVGAAAVAKAGLVTLYAYHDDRNSGAVSLRSMARDRSAYDVPGVRLDDIASAFAIERVDVMKIDVEGAERIVLDGAPEILQRFRPTLVVEITASDELDRLERILTFNDYEFSVPTSNGSGVALQRASSLSEALNGAAQVDVVASPTDRQLARWQTLVMPR